MKVYVVCLQDGGPVAVFTSEDKAYECQKKLGHIFYVTEFTLDAEVNYEEWKFVYGGYGK